MGLGEPHAAVKVETSWGAGAAVKSDADGRWAVSVRTPAGSYEPQRITFASGDRVTFDRVLIGEVWFAGGQEQYGDAARRFLAVSGYGCERDHRPRGRQKAENSIM